MVSLANFCNFSKNISFFFFLIACSRCLPRFKALSILSGRARMKDHERHENLFRNKALNGNKSCVRDCSHGKSFEPFCLHVLTVVFKIAMLHRCLRNYLFDFCMRLLQSYPFIIYLKKTFKLYFVELWNHVSAVSK